VSWKNGKKNFKDVQCSAATKNLTHRMTYMTGSMTRDW